jgi:hypothetical protein
VKHFRLQQQSVRDNENVVLQIEYWWKHILWMNECRQWAATALRRMCSECRIVKPMQNNMHNIHGDRYCTNTEMEYWAWQLSSASPIRIQNLLLCNHVSHKWFCEWQWTLPQVCLTFCLNICAMYRIWF